jgi:4-hydroxy-2-oxoglutarate aldolase
MPQSLDGKLLVPAVSTFDSDGEIDASAFQANIRAWIDQGMDGVLVAGSSGESPLLESDDRRKLISLAREVIPNDRWLLAGVGSESTRLTIARAKDAKAAGADAVLVVSPHYFLKRMTDAALLAHFKAVADASPLPVLLYNIPVYAHVVLSSAVVNELSRHENIIGMKDSAGNLSMLQQYIESQSDSFQVLTGSGATFVTALEMGAAGAILAIALFAGLPVRAAFDAARAGKAAEAAILQTRLAPLAIDIGAPMGPPGVKAAMDLVGLKGGKPRSPLLPVNSAEAAIIRSRLESAGLLPT